MSGGTESKKVQVKGEDNFQIVPDCETATCIKCGCWLGELGKENTPEDFVDHLVEVFREVRRVLRDDGVLWVNLGPTFSGSGRAGGEYGPGGMREGQPKWKQAKQKGMFKPLDMIPIPWMFGFAMIRDGWYLRCDCIWNVVNAMPESMNGWRWEKCRVKDGLG